MGELDVEAPVGTKSRVRSNGDVELHKNDQLIGFMRKAGDGPGAGWWLHTADGKQGARMGSLGSGLRALNDQHVARTGWGKKKPDIDSRHAGATMSDREFAKLQMQRDAPGTHSSVKRRLTSQINAEIKRRKEVSK